MNCTSFISANGADVYRTRFGDTLSSDAQLFSTTTDGILAVNPDVPALQALAVYTMLCVQPRVS